jgi:hypothetical protein
MLNVMKQAGGTKNFEVNIDTGINGVGENGNFPNMRQATPDELSSSVEEIHVYFIDNSFPQNLLDIENDTISEYFEAKYTVQESTSLTVEEKDGLLDVFDEIKF